MLEVDMNAEPIDDVMEAAALLCCTNRKTGRLRHVPSGEQTIELWFLTGPYGSVSATHAYRVTERVVRELGERGFITLIYPTLQYYWMTSAGECALFEEMFRVRETDQERYELLQRRSKGIPTTKEIRARLDRKR